MTRKELIESTNSTLNSTVKIAGTNYDRRRKVTNDMKRRMIQMVNAGKSYTTIADHFNVTPYTVKLNTNEEFRTAEYARRAQYPQYSEAADANERAEYKRGLLKAGKKLTVR